MLHSDFFDMESEPVIDLHFVYGQPGHMVDKCMIVFSHAIHAYLLKHYDCKEIAQLSVCNGRIPIYCLTYKGQNIAFYLTGIGSAVASSLCYEAHWLTGATTFIMFGSCGSLDGERTRGCFIIPTESYRGEGASHYYAPASDYLPIKNSRRLAEIFESLHAPYVCGRVWTTDSMLRETRGLVEKRKQEGCIAVEMELAGVQAVCDFYGLELFDFLEAGDVLADSGYEIEGLHEANHGIGKALLALEIALFL